MGARNRVGIGLSYQPARLQSLVELIHWNQFLGTLKLKSLKIRARGYTRPGEQFVALSQNKGGKTLPTFKKIIPNWKRHIHGKACFHLQEILILITKPAMTNRSITNIPYLTIFLNLYPYQCDFSLPLRCWWPLRGRPWQVPCWLLLLVLKIFSSFNQTLW